MKRVIRYIRLIFGLLLYGFGGYLCIQANIGLAPWDAFQMGISNLTGMQYGNTVILTGAVLLIVGVLLGEQIGIGTCLNIILIGKFIDIFFWISPVPVIQNYWLGLIVMLLGQIFICVGTYFYIGSELGAGPRDSLMLALNKRFKTIPIGVIRAIIEGMVLLFGWLMGSKVGLGTVMAAFGLGVILQGTFRILHFDAKLLRHESIFETLHMKKTRNNS